MMMRRAPWLIAVVSLALCFGAGLMLSPIVLAS